MDPTDPPDLDPPDLDPRLAVREREGHLVERIRSGDQAAFAELYENWFDRVHDLVARIVHDREVAAEVAQDTFLAAWQKLDTLDRPEAFGGWLLRIARNRALNRLERERRAVAVDDDVLAGLERTGAPVNAPDGFGAETRLACASDPEVAAADGEVAALLWSAADALGERDATVLSLQLRYGMTPAEIGEVVGVNRNAANQLVHRVKGRLESAVRARVLWGDEGPVCDGLRSELAAAGVQSFDDQAVKLVSRHVEHCDTCGERQRLQLSPTALFGALPVLAAPAGLREQIAAALAGHGVPLDVTGDPSGDAAHDGAGSDANDGATGAGAGEDGGGSGASEPGAGPDGVPGSPPGSVSDGEPLGDRPGATDPRTSRRRALAAASVVALLLVAIVTVALLAGDGGGDDDVLLAEASPSDSTTPTTASTAPSAPTTVPDTVGSIAPVSPDAAGPTTPPGSSVAPVPTGDDAPAPEPGGSVVPPASPDAGGGGPAPVPVTAQLTVSPNSVPGTFIADSSLPTLTWSTTGAASVAISGPGVSASGTSGSRSVCPGMVVPGGCQAQFGTYSWTLVAFDAGGGVVALRSATITV